MLEINLEKDQDVTKRTETNTKKDSKKNKEKVDKYPLISYI